MPQLHLNFAYIPIPETCLWEKFEDEQKWIVIEILAGLLAWVFDPLAPSAIGS